MSTGDDGMGGAKLISLRPRYLILFGLVIGFTMLLTSCGGEGTGSAMNPKDTVAVVNGTRITAGELYATMVVEYGQEALDQLITDKLIAGAAKEAGVTATDAEIEERLNELAADYGGRDAFQILLLQSGFTEDRIRDDLHTSLLVEKTLTPTFDLSEEALAAHYSDNEADFTLPDRIHTRHILVETEAEAEGILQRLTDGEDFATTAAELSVDPSAAENHGDIGWRARGELVPEYFDAAFAAAPGDRIGPVSSSHGFHVIELIDREESHTPDFDEAREEVLRSLIDAQMAEKAGPWLRELHGNAEIDNRLLDD